MPSGPILSLKEVAYLAGLDGGGIMKKDAGVGCNPQTGEMSFGVGWYKGFLELSIN